MNVTTNYRKPDLSEFRAGFIYEEKQGENWTTIIYRNQDFIKEKLRDNLIRTSLPKADGKTKLDALLGKDRHEVLKLADKLINQDWKPSNPDPVESDNELNMVKAYRQSAVLTRLQMEDPRPIVPDDLKNLGFNPIPVPKEKHLQLKNAGISIFELDQKELNTSNGLEYVTAEYFHRASIMRIIGTYNVNERGVGMKKYREVLFYGTMPNTWVLKLIINLINIKIK